MHVLAPCVICFKAGQPHRDRGEKVPIVLWPGKMSDDGFVLVQCNQRHETVIVYDARKYELLLDSACLALIDNYDREAVSGFAAALERAYEFFVRVVCRAKQVERDTFDQTWKLLSAQSERQLGAFLFLYALEVRAPYRVDRKQVEFRNKVIHAGYIPNREEVHSYGDYVFGCCRDLIQILKEKHERSLAEEIKCELTERHAKAPKGVPTLQMWVKPVNVDRRTDTATEIDTFDGYLDAMIQRREKQM